MGAVVVSDVGKERRRPAEQIDQLVVTGTCGHEVNLRVVALGAAHS
jgi:hypothetical protein